METLYASFQGNLMSVCLWGLAVSVILLAAVSTTVLKDHLQAFIGLSVPQKAVLLLCICGIWHYGATKPKVTYDGGIKAAVTANVISNDIVRIEWQRDMSYPIPVPLNAPVYIDYRLSSETNSEWGLLGQATLGDWHWYGTIPDATNYDYNVWAYYIEPEPVHTNGVWIYKTLKDRRDANPIPLRARVEVDGKAIATPKEKRKDEGHGDL